MSDETASFGQSAPVPPVETRDAGIVLVLSFFTCGLYLVYWYYKIYQELEALTGQTPTGQLYIVDFLLNLVTCSLYGIWVDYQISQRLFELQKQVAYPMPEDTAMTAVVLDLSAFVTGFVTNFISSSIQQNQLNKTVRHMQEQG